MRLEVVLIFITSHAVLFWLKMILNYLVHVSCFVLSETDLSVDKSVLSEKKEQQLLAELDTIRHDKEQQILKLKEGLQEKQVEMLSPSDLFEQREKEMLAQKGTQNKYVVHMVTVLTIIEDALVYIYMCIIIMHLHVHNLIFYSILFLTQLSR